VILNLYLEGRRRHDRWQANQHLLATESIGGVLDEQVLEERRVQAALALLSPRQRACVILRFYDDFSVAAIADELGCGEGTVKRHLADAKVRLADQLGITEESV
jgi:RNA polymerase sigma factor (sigma-70 family)